MVLLPGDKVSVVRARRIPAEFTDVISSASLHEDGSVEYYFMETDDEAFPDECTLVSKGNHDGIVPEAKYAVGDYIMFIYDMDKKEYVRKITEVTKYLDIDEPARIRYTVDCENLDWANEEDVKGKMVLA